MLAYLHIMNNTYTFNKTSTIDSIGRKLFWIENKDCIDIKFEKEGVMQVKTVCFMVHGKPIPMQRPKTANKGKRMYSPSSPLVAQFRDLIKKQMISILHCDNDMDVVPLFCDKDMLKIDVLFKMKRPMNHFVKKNTRTSLKPMYNRENCSTTYCSAGGDIDNLAKFILDGLQNVMYKNDRQVVQLNLRKCWDNEGKCLGGVMIKIEKLENEL